MKKILQFLLDSETKNKKLLAILIDPDKFDLQAASEIIHKAEKYADFLLIGGSTDDLFKTEKTVEVIKDITSLPVVLFPGAYTQITPKADALLFLSLLSGRNPEYLIEQHIKAVPVLKKSEMEIIPTGYILIDGGKESAVQRVSGTQPISQTDVELIVNTAVAGAYSGKKLIYLEAGSGAENPIGIGIISEVKKEVKIPIIVGGGIKSRKQIEKAYEAGADIVVVGTAFEEGFFG